MTASDAAWEPASAYPQLHALACAMRPDWNPTELRDAMTSVHQANWSWKEVFREVARLVLAEDETPATLRNSARKPTAVASSSPLNPDLKAELLANLAHATRKTGGQPVLTDTDH